MKRISLFLVAAVTVLVACSNETDTLSKDDDSNNTRLGGSEDESKSTKKTETPAQTQQKATTPPPPAKTTNAPVSCSASADAASCAKCCATEAAKDNPLTACACGAGSTCGDKCTGNLCDGKLPSLDCALCVAQANCDLGFGNDGNGNDIQNSAAAQCLQQCADKFGQNGQN